MFVKSQLKSIPFLEHVSEKELKDLARIGKVESCDSNRTIFVEGDPADNMYLILDGKVRISKRDEDGAEIELATLAKGEFFGELALVDEGARSATVSTVGPCKLLILSRDSFTELLSQSPSLIPVLFMSIAKKIRSFNEQFLWEVLEKQRLSVRHAFSDALTGLANRALLLDHLGRALKRRGRHPDYLFAVLFLDLDRFKMINDSLGHNIGDELLRAVARRLEKCPRSQDTVARLGGDEFTILLEDIKDETDATRVAERIHKELRTSFQVDGHEVFTTSSIGIALSSTGYAQAEDLLRDADLAMYRAKALGKACYSMFDTAMHDRAVALLQLDRDLRRALERKEFRLHYQPIVWLETAKVIGLEALLRWEHPARGFVSPAEFIPLAEETRLIIPIGRWVLEEACRQARAWQTQFGAALPVSVNLSGRQLSQPDLVDQITQILQEFSLDGRSLKLEITESMIMENIESVITMLQQLKALGIQTSMDDFGTGYSSLSYLHRLPIDVLKIDRSFVSGTGLGVEKPEVVRTVITLARDLGIDAVAEGVGTAEQLAQLRGLGCKYGQGYLFSKPVDAEAAGKFIAGQLQIPE